MAEKTKTLSQRAVAVIAAVFVMLTMMMISPVVKEANAAGTDLYVGYSGKSNNFSTVQAAVNKAASLNPTSENDRITIHIAPGTYREQVLINTPYITFVNDEPSKGDALITFYYGIGYKYYSVNTSKNNGTYDASLASAKSQKNTPYRWGATVWLQNKAQYFKAKNIVFENSFNRYITKEELADGVELVGDTSVSSISQVRNSSTDVQSKAATERAAAFAADAGYCEFLGCKFLSSQDTLYTGASPQYYKNCHIEGQTDYIFGDSSAVFDSCELCWKGYSSNAAGGYITAARDDGNNDSGYLFSSCKVTKNPSLTVKTGYLGRPWRDTAKVMFINTTLQSSDCIDATGWYSMSGVQPENVAGFKEYGTKLSNGSAVDLSKRKGHTISASDAEGIKLTNYMKNWTPTYLNSSPGSTDPGTNVSGAITLCGGWYEEAFAEWDSSKIGSNVKVSYAPAGTSSFTAADSELIRGSRVDIPGLKGNTSYTLRIEGSSGSAQCTIKTMAFDRSGYAHWNYNSGVGAYNNDGTLKSGVTVIYVTNSNKDSISYGGKTGLYNIFYSAKPQNVVFRFIGKIDVPSGAKANDGKQNDGSSMLYLQYGENVTIEGIGYDANLNKWGFEMKRCTGCEVRNLWLGQYPDDGISMTGDSSNKSSHMWIHNNTIEKGYNAYAGNGTVDADKADGDGSTDIKWSEYVTISYNYYIDCHKTSLVGGGPTQMQDWITYHHNWFSNTESRNPRARNAHIHSYNNYFTNNKQYGLGASYNSKIFSEANYYEKTYLPLDAVNMGSDAYSGTIKSYGDKFDGCTMGSNLAYKIAGSRTEKVSVGNLKSGGDAYDNFDTDPSKIYGSYNVQTPDAAKSEVMEYSGRMRQGKAYNSGSADNDPPVVIDQPLKSDLIAKLDIKDTAYGSSWAIKENVQAGDKAFGDREHVFASLPSGIIGAEQVVTACDSKKTDSDLAVLTAAKDIIVYVALDERVTSVPSWLGSFTKNGSVVEINDTEALRPFIVYEKKLMAGESIVLGTNGMSGACMNYTAFAAEYKEPITTTTTTTTSSTTTTTTTQPENIIWGDADCDGNVKMNDAVLIMQSISNPDRYGIEGDQDSHITDKGSRNGNVFETYTSGLTPKDALQIQSFLLHQIPSLDPEFQQ